MDNFLSPFTSSNQKLISLLEIESFSLDICKTRNTGIENGMRAMQKTRGMFTRIPEECSSKLRVMPKKIPGNLGKVSGESFREFRGM